MTVETSAAGTGDDLLIVEDLRIEYLSAHGSSCVVDDVTFRIKKGEIVGLAGESGSGKTTIGMGILRLLRPPAAITGGRVTLAGEDMLSMTDARLRQVRWRKVSWVAQSAMNALNPVLTIGEQLGDVFEVHEKMGKKAALAASGELLQLVGIDPRRISSYPHQLSGGMRQRVVIAMALALRPPLVIMDEPTTALDVVVQREILGQIVRLQRSLGFSVLFITHDLSLMFEMCNQVGILRGGKLLELGPARELFERPQHAYTQELLHSVVYA